MTEMVDLRHWGTNDVPISDEAVKLLQKMHCLGLKPFNEVSVEEGRKQMKDMYAAFTKPRSYSGKMKDIKVPSPEVPDGIPVKVYTPKSLPADPVIMLYFHGGAQLYGHIDHFVSVYKALSSTCKCIIVAVNYRLAPEHKLPAGIDDCEQATKWVLENKTTLGGTDKSPVGVAGDSSGGQNAACVALRVKDLNFQVLVYPGTDMTMEKSPSFDEFHDGPIGTRTLCEWFCEQVLPKDAAKDDPRWSPMFHPDVSNAPRTLVILAEVDPLRDDGSRYAEKLKDAGVDTKIKIIKGAIHTFFTLPNIFTESSKEAYSEINEFIKDTKPIKK